MTTTEELQDQLQNALNELEDAKARIAQLESTVQQVVALAEDYRTECIGQANTFDRMLRSITK